MIRRGAWTALAGLTLIAAPGCAGTTTTTTERAPSVPASAPTTARAIAPGTTAKATPNNPAQPPDAGVTTGCNEVRVGHACRATTAAPSDPNQSPQRNCDTNIVANAATSCGLAENAFYEFYRAGASSSGRSIMVHSPTTGHDYELFCEPGDGLVACTGSPLSTGIYTSFPQSAIDEYTAAQADAYARSRDVGNPGPARSQSDGKGVEAESGAGQEPSSSGSNEREAESHEASPEPSECTNGSYVNSSGNTVCKPEESSSGPPAGATAECEDGTYSFSEHRSGTCSNHGGVKRWL